MWMMTPGGRHYSPVPAVGYQKAADLGDAEAMAALGAFFLNGNARAGLAKDAARGLAFLRQAVDEGCLPAKLPLAQCYLKVWPDG